MDNLKEAIAQVDELERQTQAAVAVMKEKGYNWTASGGNGNTLFFLKKIDQRMDVHGMVYLKRNIVVLDIIGMMEYGISVRSMELPLDTNLFEKTENELIAIIRIYRQEDVHSAIPVPQETLKPQKIEVTLEDRKKEFWDRIREAGKPKGYEKEMCLEFRDYWMEMNENGKKMRFEMEKVFDVSRRLATWLKHDKEWSKRYEKIQSFQDQKAEVQNKELETAGKKVINRKDLF